MRMYLVGGAVRDELLGIPSKDIDFTCVLDPGEVTMYEHLNVWSPFDIMTHRLKAAGFKIFLETPQYLTVRARFPKFGPNSFNNLTADFVLARKESGYSDGRRPDDVVPGTLEDDLARRDFRMNAIAKDEDGSLIDPFNGVEDIERRIIRAVGDPFERLNEDALRAIRAVRFAVTKGFEIEVIPATPSRMSLASAMESEAVLDKIRNKIADERIREELSLMFRFDTLASLKILKSYPALTEAIFSGSVSLDSTMKTKGRGR